MHGWFVQRGFRQATVFHSLSNRPPQTNSLGFDPLTKMPDGTKATNKYQVANPMMLHYAPEAKSWAGPAVMVIDVGGSDGVEFVTQVWAGMTI